MNLTLPPLWARTGRRTKSAAFLLAALALAGVGTLFFGKAETASAHCDSVNGPVVNAAEKALDTGDVNLILPYVKEDQEAELTAAFNQAMEVRRAGGEAKALADRYFFETAVRLHRQGEGASYTGLKDGEEMPPALAAAEHALESGELKGVFSALDKEIKAGVEQHYHAVLEAREAEAKKPSVETARARVEAEFTFEKYVLGISEAATATGHSEEPAAATGHSHE